MRACVNFCVPIPTLKPLKPESRNFLYGFLIKKCTLIFFSFPNYLPFKKYGPLKI